MSAKTLWALTVWNEIKGSVDRNALDGEKLHTLVHTLYAIINKAIKTHELTIQEFEKWASK